MFLQFQLLFVKKEGYSSLTSKEQIVSVLIFAISDRYLQSNKFWKFETFDERFILELCGKLFFREKDLWFRNYEAF